MKIINFLGLVVKAKIEMKESLDCKYLNKGQLSELTRLHQKATPGNWIAKDSFYSRTIKSFEEKI